jgi:cytidyltransferase-like protein
MTKVLVFGVFDGLHAGHDFLFKEASRQGDKLVVALTPDELVLKAKGHLPKFNFEERLEHLRQLDSVSEVVVGDAQFSSWHILDRVKPNVIVLGYDQQGLEKDLARHIKLHDLNLKIHIASPFEPDKYHSSLLNK